MKTDPICGLTVNEATALSARRDSETFYICSEHRRKKFLGQPMSKESGNGSCCGGKANAQSSAGDCCGGKAQHEHHHHAEHKSSTEKHSCCGGKADLNGRSHADYHNHSHHHHHGEAVTPSAAVKYFCPMRPGVESDKPGACPQCGQWTRVNESAVPTNLNPAARRTHPTRPAQRQARSTCRMEKFEK